MRKLTAFLVLLAAAFPAAGTAQIKVGVIGESGLGTVAAPVPTINAPALQLSPSSLSAASLAPSIPAAAVAPVLAVSVQAAPAKPVIPDGAKIVPAALAAVTPAAATPEKPGSDEARAAGAALFDGAMKLSAPAIGDGPSVPGSQSDPARASGLSPPTDSELAAAYKEARPKSKAVETLGRDFVAAAGDIVQKYTFMGEHFLQQLNPKGENVMDFRGRAIYRAVADLVGTHDAREDGASRRFMQLLGRWSAHKDHANEEILAMKIAMMKAMGSDGPPRHLPPSPIPHGEYWDMAAGMNAQGFIHRELDPNTNYSFFDYSPFVVSYLKTAAELAGKKNAAVVEGDINALTKPAKPLAVLRTKNAVNYVPGFDKKLEEMADWIAPGGQLVIQNDPNPGQRSTIVSKHGPLIRRLIAEGWEFEFGFSGTRGKWGDYGLDTIVLTRPKAQGKRSPAEAQRQWSTYEGAVQYLERSFNPFQFLFR